MKKLTEEEILSIKKDLISSKSAKRRSAAKKIGKYHIISMRNELLEAYIKERQDVRTWETQAVMITALGKVDHKAAVPYLQEIIDRNKEFDAITADAALAYIRLTRKNPNDMETIINFMTIGNASVFDGAVMALAYDDIVPTESEMKKVIEILNMRKAVYDRPYSNPVAMLISAMYKWPQEISLPFLTQYQYDLQYAHLVVNTLAGKRSYRDMS